MQVKFRTKLGTSFCGSAEELATSPLVDDYRQNINLIFTSPPFPLNRKKKYGNKEGQQYIDWLASFAPIFKQLLASNGSIVMELGNSWEKGVPVMSTLALRALLAFLDAGQFFLCQQFIWHNPARLPSPAQWVNVERIRVKDAYTHLWWMSTSERPKADNRQVLTDYSPSMKRLLDSQKYNPGRRPSEHHIGATSFLTNNGGAIPSNVLTFANTQPNSEYLRYCRENKIVPHPARMPLELPKFFIGLLTTPGDCVLDPFAGSNTTGAASEQSNRRWASVEVDEGYIEGSKAHFLLHDV